MHLSWEIQKRKPHTLMQGEAKASLILHVNAIKIHQVMKNNTAASFPQKEAVAVDLPF